LVTLSASRSRQLTSVEENKIISRLPVGLLPFLPFVFYGCAATANYWRVATGGGLILSLIVLAILRQRGITIKLMDWTLLTVFVIASVFMIVLRSTRFPVYSEVVIWSCFAMAAWFSIAIGRPFTAVYARETAPLEFWTNPVFIRLNRLMSLFWATLMSINVGFTILGVIVGGTFGQLGPGLVLPTVLLILGYVFSNRFPGGYLARAGF
jgi:intracellular septation protein A